MEMLSILIVCNDLSNCLMYCYRKYLPFIITQTFETLSSYLSSFKSDCPSMLTSIYPLLSSTQSNTHYNKELFVRIIEDSLHNLLPILSQIPSIIANLTTHHLTFSLFHRLSNKHTAKNEYYWKRCSIFLQTAFKFLMIDCNTFCKIWKDEWIKLLSLFKMKIPTNCKWYLMQILCKFTSIKPDEQNGLNATQLREIEHYLGQIEQSNQKNLDGLRC